MKRSELEDLHYITPIANVPSILKQGILSHTQVQRLRHRSVAMKEVQDLRAKVKIPGGRKLHDYANLYICGRNPMLYKRLDIRDQLCVLSVSPDVLDLQGVIISDSNSGSQYARFAPAPNGLNIVDREAVFCGFLDRRGQNHLFPQKGGQVCRSPGSGSGAGQIHSFRLRCI